MGIKEKVKRGELSPHEALLIVQSFKPVPKRLERWLLRRLGVK